MDSDRNAKGRFISAAHKSSHWWGVGVVIIIVFILIALFAR
jgi:hypothetical protein